ncbi:AAA family ATPase [uncultured Fusobacterium sp.]|uniref:AAA family ATPase n=1 Tax=uncultured Fusobacterium sp. TaxID=159267 RepID=UPI002599BC70|nr:AAA family ATPase [uncultured Fusobacterium sp.]
MSDIKGIALGIDDFKTLIEENCYYVDKSKFIEEILKDKAGVKLFTRPRRFGKTLNMSMLRYFFDIKNAEENRSLFKELYIEKSPAIKEQGKYPVIFLSMKEIQGKNYEEIIERTRAFFKLLYNEYVMLRENLNQSELQDFDEIWLGKKNIDLSTALLKLSLYLKKYYNQKVIILIDEYDVPLMSAYENGCYDEVIQFFKILYGAVLKSNSNIKMGVLTGAIRVAQAGIFSDLNNLKINTIFNEAYDEYFGLSQKEVEDILRYYGMEYTITEVKSWYDGYKFGKAEVYNPWSILNYIDNKELKAYWINTSGNVLIKNLLLLSDGVVFDDLQNLVNGNERIVFINENIAFGNNLSPNHLWELLLFSGYLTVKEKMDDKTYLVKIPNKEILTFFKEMFVSIIFRGSSNIGDMKQALQSKNINHIINILEEVVVNAMSFYDTSKKYENSYQTLLSGFMYGLNSFYQVLPNVESGYGRADIILKPRNKNWAGYIFELKRANDNDMKMEAEKALNQIEDKKYDNILKNEEIKDIIKIGLVFKGKKVESSYSYEKNDFNVKN